MLARLLSLLSPGSFSVLIIFNVNDNSLCSKIDSREIWSYFCHFVFSKNDLIIIKPLKNTFRTNVQINPSR